jgi:hypothetical protein
LQKENTHFNTQLDNDILLLSGFFSLYTQATLKFTELNTQAQQREAVVQGRSLSPIPASV